VIATTYGEPFLRDRTHGASRPWAVREVEERADGTRVVTTHSFVDESAAAAWLAERGDA
jgi:hypothetical protein